MSKNIPQGEQNVSPKIATDYEKHQQNPGTSEEAVVEKDKNEEVKMGITSFSCFFTAYLAIC